MKATKVHLATYETPGPRLLAGMPEEQVNCYLKLESADRVAEIEALVGTEGVVSARDWRILAGVARALLALPGLPDGPDGVAAAADGIMQSLDDQARTGSPADAGNPAPRSAKLLQSLEQARAVAEAVLGRFVQSPQASGTIDQAARASTMAELFLRSRNSLLLPEGKPPTYIYQPEGSVEQSAPMQPNGYEDTQRMIPLGTMDAKSHLLERECVRRGLGILRTGRGVFTASRDGHKLHFKLSRSPLVSVTAISLCTHKEATREFLAPLGFPVPQGRMFRSGDHDNACAFARLIGYPVVLKPATGVRGIGVVPGIQDESQLRSAFSVLESSKLGHDDFIVEKHIFGADYRIMVIGGKARAATLRAPASVMGDGQRTVAELILAKNAYRQMIPHLKSRPIVYSGATRYQLEKVGYDLSSVPREGETVVLSGSCNLSQGGDSVNVTDEMHPSILQVAEDAVKAVPGLDYCGIDLLIGDHRKPAGETDIGICELNAHAAIGTACYPMYGPAANVPRLAVEEMLEKLGVPSVKRNPDRIAVRIRIRGKVTGTAYRKWFRRHALRSGIKGYVRNVNKRQVEAVVEGNLVAVTALATACIRGPSKAIPTSVQTTSLKWRGYEDFRIETTDKTHP